MAISTPGKYGWIAICTTIATLVAVFIWVAPRYKIPSTDQMMAPDSSMFQLPSVLNCTDGFAAKRSPVPSRYHVLKHQFRLYLVEQNLAVEERHDADWLQEEMTFSALANQRHVRTVCETTFNSVKSTLMWLVANPAVHVYSFNVGQREYVEKAKVFLSRTFRDRVHLVSADSTLALPKFIAANPDVKCDLTLIDGSHFPEEVTSDILNFYHLARGRNNVLILDDHPNMHWLKLPWHKAIEDDIVEEIFRCEYPDMNKGFTIGRYINLGRNRPRHKFRSTALFDGA